MLRRNIIRKFASRIQTFFAAAAYAESGEFERARQIIAEEPDEPLAERIHPRTDQAMRTRPRVG